MLIWTLVLFFSTHGALVLSFSTQHAEAVLSPRIVMQIFSTQVLIF